MIYLYNSGVKRGRFFILEASGVKISYGKKVVFENAYFSIGDGESTAILGKNGSGKSTLLKALSGVHRVECGEVLLDGRSVYNKEERVKIGFVPQNDIAFDNLSVRDNLAFWGAVYGLSAQKAADSSISTLLGLGGVMKEKAKRLSGGMRKRLCIAASLLHNPQILILDEPFSSIDIVAKQELLEYLTGFKNEGKTIILTSHNASELTALCDNFRAITGKRLQTVDDLDKSGANPEEWVANIIMQGD